MDEGTLRWFEAVVLNEWVFMILAYSGMVVYS
jgi:hypothetical protein